MEFRVKDDAFAISLLLVGAFALGVLVRDVAQDYRDAKALAACQQNAAEYASHLSKLLTDGGRLTAPGTVVSCKARHIQVGS
jgi:hypothetical protein